MNTMLGRIKEALGRWGSGVELRGSNWVDRHRVIPRGYWALIAVNLYFCGQKVRDLAVLTLVERELDE